MNLNDITNDLQRLMILEGAYALVIFPNGWRGKPFDNLYRIEKVTVVDNTIDLKLRNGRIQVRAVDKAYENKKEFIMIESSDIINVTGIMENNFSGGRLSFIYGEGLDVPNQIELAKIHFS